MNISDLSSIHAGPLAEFLGKKWEEPLPQIKKRHPVWKTIIHHMIILTTAS